MRSKAAFLAFACAFGAWAASGSLDRRVLFERGKGDYLFYRIPGLVVTKSGAILAYAEARQSDRSDWGPTDLILRRSTDGGKTWSHPAIIGRMTEQFAKNPAAAAKKLGSGITYNNPVAIADRSGAVHFLFCVEYMRVFYVRSDDDGGTFTKPVEITAAVEPLKRIVPWVVVATGPGHGIQLKNGRLLVPIWLSLGTGGGAHGDSVVSTLYSDDAGASWKSGDLAVPNDATTASPNETVAVELADGRVMLNVRSPSKPQRRIEVFSKDGATQWSQPRFDDGLPDPSCFAGMIRVKKKTLLFSDPDAGARTRKNLTVRLSRDGGRTWPEKRALEPGPSAYSDLAVARDGTILCFHEAGTKTPYDSLTLARFPLSWVTKEK